MDFLFTLLKVLVLVCLAVWNARESHCKAIISATPTAHPSSCRYPSHPYFLAAIFTWLLQTFYLLPCSHVTSWLAISR